MLLLLGHVLIGLLLLLLLRHLMVRNVLLLDLLRLLLLPLGDGVLHSLIVDALLHLLLFALSRFNRSHQAAASLRLRPIGRHADQRSPRHASDLFLFAG